MIARYVANRILGFLGQRGDGVESQE